jgi:hypothetical protein
MRAVWVAVAGLAIDGGGSVVASRSVIQQHVCYKRAAYSALTVALPFVTCSRTV